MVYSMGLPEGHRKPARNIYQRRAYAAQRALTAIHKYSFLPFAQKSDDEKQRTVRWMRAWMAFAISYGESHFEAANRPSPGHAKD